jgi:hypothetical protein
MFRRVLAIGIVGVIGCILRPAHMVSAGDAEKIDPGRQLVFKVRGLT